MGANSDTGDTSPDNRTARDKTGGDRNQDDIFASVSESIKFSESVNTKHESDVMTLKDGDALRAEKVKDVVSWKNIKRVRRC